MAEKDSYQLDSSAGIQYSKITEYAVCVNNQDPKRAGRIRAVKPFGSTNISTTVRSAASEVCNWSTESIISAIRRLA